MSKSSKFYVVWVGKKPGIYETWAKCLEQTKGFSGAQYKAFTSYNEAEKAFKGEESVVNNGYIKESLSVDAACSGNPGVMEYKIVWTSTEEVIFQSKEYPIGTNNIAEFLALVDALEYSQEKKEAFVIYTDSQTALAWLRNKRVNTNLERNDVTEELWTKIDDSIAWLKNNSYQNQILKWDTKAWGEIKADFGRK